MRTGAPILDIYDDPSLLVQRLIQDGSMPTKLAESRLLEPAQLAAMPDRLFALVGELDGMPVRKYAMHDESHCATSIFYLLEHGAHYLDDESAKIAAGNLVNACEWYDIDPPPPLVKLAILGKVVNGVMGVSDMAGHVGKAKSTGTIRRDAFRQAQVTGFTPKTAGSGHDVELSLDDENALFGNGDTPHRVQAGLDSQKSKSRHWIELDAIISGDDTGEKKAAADFIDTLTEDQILEDPHFDPKGGYRSTQELRQKYKAYAAGDKQHWFAGSHGLHAEMYGTKKADLNGTEMMPHGMNTKPMRVNTAVTRSKGAHIIQYNPPAEERKVAHYALAHVQRYPIDTAAEVKTAAAYFEEHSPAFQLLERRVFADTVYHRAQDLGVKVAGKLLDYAGDGYGPHINHELSLRIARYAGVEKSAGYETALAKKASMSPAVMVAVLTELDQQTGADQIWNSGHVGFRDPYAAVYGAAKVAEESKDKNEDVLYTWQGDADTISGTDLMAYAERNAPTLKDTFGEALYLSYIKDPIAIFKSLPEPQKIVVSRMARSGLSGAAG